ncbi:MAG: hypothetical protein PVJ51_05805, partial [Acidobacteriota bacterium]
MMEKLGKTLGVARPEYVIVFLLIAILGLLSSLDTMGVGQRFFLPFYFLPVMIAGYTLGVRGGVAAAMASAAFVLLFFLVGKPELVPHVPPQGTATVSEVRAWWADITLWAGLLIVSGAAVGQLYERSRAALDDLRQAYSGMLEILVKFIDTADRYTEAHSVRVS